MLDACKQYGALRGRVASSKARQPAGRSLSHRACWTAGGGRFRAECVLRSAAMVVFAANACFWKSVGQNASECVLPQATRSPPFRTLRVKCLVDGLRFSRLPGCHAPKGVGSHVGARTRWQNDQHFLEITHSGQEWPPATTIRSPRSATRGGPATGLGTQHALAPKPTASPTPRQPPAVIRVPKQPGPERPCASGPRKSPYWLAALPSETCSTVPSFPARPEPGGVKPPSPSGGRPARCYACSIAASTAVLIASLVTEAPAMESTSVEFASTILAGSCSTAMLPM